jgi:hypothetical protein
MTHGLDVTGWSDQDGFSPSVAVVCPGCASEWHAGGQELTHEEWESLAKFSARCVVCGQPSTAWRIDADGCEACA